MADDRDFGMGRVLYPKNVAPVAAWKIDNSIEISPREARIKIEVIHIECDSFQQICSACGYDEAKIKAKIFDIIEKRGKLHNPFTKSGGVLLGTVDAIGSEFNSQTPIAPGDSVYCITSISGMPIKLESIEAIDYDYGQITCTGYGIIFESFPVRKRKFLDIDPSYALAAVDEASSFFGSYKLAKDIDTVAIIGKSIHTTLLYGAAIKEAKGDNAKIVAIMDNHVNDQLTHEEIASAMSKTIDSTFFVDLTRPMEAFDYIKEEHSTTYLPIKSLHEGSVDLIIVAEDIFGAETLAIALIKPKGNLYFSSVENHYATASLIAETLGKEMTMHSFEQYSHDYPEFTLKLLLKVRDELEALNRLYREKRQKKALTESQSRNMRVTKIGASDDFVFQSLVTKNMVDEVLNIAKYDCNVIIQGETGVGKEKVLSIIHQNSQRRSEPCIKINCATIAENLAESEFFGYEPGAFTGARDAGKKGYFEMANNGILFLDEIGALSINMQSKLLRVLQESQFYRVGGTQQVSVNVRVIVANNINLKKLVKDGEFREDLYYRLNICTIEVPPLRERREDVICLSEAFVDNWKKKYSLEKELSPGALTALYHYDWPGNVRELENVIHRLVISSRNIVLSEEDVTDLLQESTYGELVLNVKKGLMSDNTDFHVLMEQQEKQIIEYALNKCKTTRKAADFLGLPQTTFARKKIKHGL